MAFAATHIMPPMEEAMDMSSPSANQLYDGDIDIDYNYGGGGTTNDDEHMSEDGQLARPGTAVTDDLMADADHAHVTSVPTIVEEEMQDSDDATQAPEQQVDDEELIDYDDEIFPDPPQEAPVGDAFQAQEQSHMKDALVAQTADSGFLAPTEVLTDDEQVDEEIVRGPGDVALEVVDEPKVLAANESTTVTADATSEVAQAAAQNDVKPASPEAGAEEQSAVESGAYDLGEETTVPAAKAREAVEVADVATEPEEHELTEADSKQNAAASAQKVPPRHPGIIDVSTNYATDAPPTPTDLTLHAMLINYGEYQLPLFKSRSQPDGLLKDDNLLNVSLTDLLSNIRTRLATKVDEADIIPEARELVLHFDIFGTMIAEVCSPLASQLTRPPLIIAQSSLHASSASLNDVLAVYLTMHKNDDVAEHDTPPLFMTLTTQPNFNHNLESLKHMAATGLGLPQVIVEDQHNTLVRDEDHAAEQQESGDVVNHETAEFDDDQEEYPEVPEDDEHDQDYNDYKEPTNGDEHDNDAVEYQEGQYQDEDDEDYFHEETAEQSTEYVSVHEGAADEPLETEIPTANADGIVRPTSDASSAVVREPATNDTTGELMPEDCIDWEDDDLTDDTTELHEDGGEDEYSALLNEYSREADEAAPANDAAANGQEHEHAQTTEHELYPNNHAQHDVDGANSGAGESEEPAAALPADVEHSKADTADLAAGDQTQDPEDGEPFTFDLLDDDGNEPFDDNDDVTHTAHHNELENDEDDIGFELDDDEAAPVSPSTSTPGNKRPYDGHADEDHIDFDEPEMKKARAD